MPMHDPKELRPPRRRGGGAWLVALVLLLAAAGFGWNWWHGRQTPGAVPAAVEQPAAAPVATQPPEPQPELPAAPQNPVEEPEGAQPALPALADADAEVGKALTELLGARRVGAFLQIDGFVRRVVATVDNLARDQAPARMWPVHPMPGRFAVQKAGGTEQIADVNAQRYDAFVAFAEGVPVEAAVRLYARLYPLFQVAYEELGFPGKYLNDRLVAVIDHLLAAPEPQGPVAVHLVQVEGQVPSLRPWVRYEYVDPQLQALSAGQKVMVRAGLQNERRLKAVLGKVRARVAKVPAARP